MKVTVEPAVLSDLVGLTFTYEEGKVLEGLFRASEEVSIGRIDGKFICLWGLVPASLLSDKAYIWSYAQSIVKAHHRTFFKWSKKIIAGMLENYPNLTCHCIGSSIFVKHMGGQLIQDHGDYSTFIIKA